jgi:hypothetical protein
MSQVAPTRRRWYQFRILTLLILMAAIAVLLTVTRHTVLDEKTTFDFVDVSLSDVVDFLSVKHKFKWRYDDKAIAAAGIKPDQIKIDYAVIDAPVGETLQKLLAPHGLVTRVDNGEVVVTVLPK